MKNIEDFSDDELYASYEAYKALLDAGLSKSQAMERAGLNADIVKELEEEDEDDDYASDFEDKWDSGKDEDDGDSSFSEDSWEEEELDDWDEAGDEDFEDDFNDDFSAGGGGWDDKY